MQLLASSHGVTLFSSHKGKLHGADLHRTEHVRDLQAE